MRVREAKSLTHPQLPTEYVPEPTFELRSSAYFPAPLYFLQVVQELGFSSRLLVWSALYLLPWVNPN